MRSVLFVCTGNICRSPTAEAVFRSYVRDLDLAEECVRYDSVGIQGYHIGESPDDRSIKVAEGHGIDMSGLFARQLGMSDFDDFDFLIAMDKGHESAMHNMCNNEGQRAKVKLLLDYCEDCRGMDVPDPYYGAMDGFERTYNLIDKGVKALIKAEF